MKNRNIFRVLSVYMIGFGIIIGIIFPFFVQLVSRIPAKNLLTPVFITSCVIAGILVGLFNIFLARKVVGKKIGFISDRMKYVEMQLLEKDKFKKNYKDCYDNCLIKDISNDEIGESAKAFNALVMALSNAFETEANIRNFTEMLTSKLDLNELAEEALNKLMEFHGASAGALAIERGGELNILCSYGIKEPEDLLKNDIVKKVVGAQKGIVVHLPDDVVVQTALVEFKPKYVLVEPILYKGVILGIVVLAGPQQITPDMQDNMSLLENGLVLALKNAISHDQLQKLAANDPLTGVFNRRFGLSRLKDEFGRAVRSNQPLGVIMLDIDHFKSINDTYGHLCGDKVIMGLANTIRSVIREGDIPLRYGGEEFVILFPGASIADIRFLSERLRRVVEDSETLCDEKKIRVTVSIGGTSFPDHEVSDYMQLINLADEKLYVAKNSGRNLAIVG